MPLYDYQCSSCGNTFESIYKISEMDKPLSEPCPKCGESTIKKLLSAPMIVDAIRLGITKPTSEFREVMKRMKKEMPGNNLKDYS